MIPLKRIGRSWLSVNTWLMSDIIFYEFSIWMVDVISSFVYRFVMYLLLYFSSSPLSLIRHT